MLKDLDIAPDDPAELRAVNRLPADEVKALTLKVEQLQHQLAGHDRHRFGSKSESLYQLNLVFREDEAIAEAAGEQAAPAPTPETDKPARRHSRKPLPDHLDRHEEVLSPGEDCRRCDGGVFTGPFVFERVQFIGGLIGGGGAVNPAQIGGHCLAVFPRAEVQGVAHQVDNAGLHRGLRKGGGIAARQTR